MFQYINSIYIDRFSFVFAGLCFFLLLLFSRLTTARKEDSWTGEPDWKDVNSLGGMYAV